MFSKFRSDRRAVTAMEYGMIASLVAVTVITAVGAMGTNISSVFDIVSTAL
jgi:pilus assembly protein Flp/PilA